MDVLHELNILNKIFQIENVDLSQLGAQIELTARSLTRMFLDAENFGVNSKYVKIFMDVAQDGTIEYRDKTSTIHTHSFLFQEIPNCGDSEGSFDACKELAQEYVQAVIDVLHVRCGYLMPLKFSALFLIPWSCHFYIGMHNYGYKFCLIISV